MAQAQATVARVVVIAGTVIAGVVIAGVVTAGGILNILRMYVTIKYILYGILALALTGFVGVAYFYVQYYSFYTNPEQAVTVLPPTEKAVPPPIAIPTTEPFVQWQGSETGTKYNHMEAQITRMSADITQSKESDTLVQQVYKKAVYYKLLSSSAALLPKNSPKAAQLFTVAHNGLYQNFTDIARARTTRSENTDHAHRVTLNAFIATLKKSANPSILIASDFKNDPSLVALNKKHPKNLDLVTALYLDAQLAKIDIVKDNLLTAEKLLNLARIGTLAEVQNDVQQKKSIGIEINRLRELFPRARKTQLTSSDVENTVRPLAQYALALGTLARFDESVKVADATNAYDSARSAILTRALSPEDELHLLLASINLNHAALLYVSAGKKVTPQVIEHLDSVVEFNTSVQSNPVLKNIFYTYLGAVASRSMPHTLLGADIAAISAAYPPLKTLIEDAKKEI
jgi:hypothetical protein